MAVTFVIPAPYRALAEGKEEITVEGHTVRAVIQALSQVYPELARRLLRDNGGLNPYVSVYCNGERLYGADVLEQPVPEGARIVIMPVIGGGCA